jgi:hypothetical protein
MGVSGRLTRQGTPRRSESLMYPPLRSSSSRRTVPDVKNMRFRSDTNEDVPERAAPQARRFPATSHGVISRPRLTVWDEYEQLDHPAWSDCVASENPQRRVGHVEGLAVGAALMSEMPPVDGNGICRFLYSEVRQVIAGASVTCEIVFSSTYEITETIRFIDHPSSGTLVEVTAWCNTAPLTEAHAEQLQHNVQQIQRAYLDRAMTWSPGVGYRGSLIRSEPGGFRYISRPS